MQDVARFDWNDLKCFVAVARAGSTIAAGRSLGVDPSTVQRRVAALERRIGQALVRRTAAGYRLTGFGESLLEPAAAVADAAAAFGRALEARAREAVGVVRVTCPEPIVLRLSAAGLLDRFHARHPRLRVEFVGSDRYLDLRDGEADVALRSGDTDDPALVGRRIADSLWAVYGSHDYLARRGRPERVEDLPGHALIGPDASMSAHRAAVWLRGVVPEAAIVGRSGSVLGMVASARAGLGLAALPTALGDAEPELVRVLGPIRQLTRSWRVLTTPTLRRTPRVAAFFEFLVDELDALGPILTG